MKDTMIYNITKDNITETVTDLMNTYSELLYCGKHSLDAVLSYISELIIYPPLIIIYNNALSFCFVPMSCTPVDQADLDDTDLST